MTGKITRLGIDSGFIHAEGGRSVPFDLSAVLTYDVAGLAVDQSVTFDVGRGSHAKAVNVVVQKHSQASGAPDKRHEQHWFRYMGFEHLGNSRAYRFEHQVPGEPRETFTVTADVALFTRHRIGIQEGPALCLRHLAVILEAAGAAAQRPQVECSLTDLEMLAHLARRPVPKKRFPYTLGSWKGAPPAPDPAESSVAEESIEITDHAGAQLEKARVSFNAARPRWL